MTPAPTSTALIRGIPDSFDRALVRDGSTVLDVELARSQHHEYQRHLEKAGYTVEEIPAADEYPDCVFIEDTAVIVGSTAVITRPGAPSRRGEPQPVAERLATRFALFPIDDPGTLDGGDVFVANDALYAGMSTRTNRDGLAQLEKIAGKEGFGFVPVEVRDVLHLKSAVLPIDSETVMVTPGTVDEAALAGLRLLYEADEERHRFSALPLRRRDVLVTADAPMSADRLATLGYEVTSIDVSEIQAADGGLTCMSILF